MDFIVFKSFRNFIMNLKRACCEAFLAVIKGYQGSQEINPVLIS